MKFDLIPDFTAIHSVEGNNTFLFFLFFFTNDDNFFIAYIDPG